MKVHLLLPAAACSLLAACVPYPVRVTPPVRGYVVDARTRHPVVGARVGFPGSPSPAALTDAQGRFSLSERRKLGSYLLVPHNVGSGLIPLEVGAERYQLFRGTVRFHSLDEPQSLEVALQPVRSP